jgi:predicted Zn-dependent peptidase
LRGRVADGTSQGGLARIEDWQCRAHHKKRVRPDKVTVVVVGDVPLEATRQRLMDAFDGWLMPAGTEAPVATDATRGAVLLVDGPKRGGRALLVVGGPRRIAAQESGAALWLAARILERRVADEPEGARLVRDTASLWDASATFTVIATPTFERLAQQLTELRRQIATLAQTPPSTDELRRARVEVNQRAARVLGDPSHLADGLENMARSQDRGDALADVGHRIADVSPEAVSAALREHVAPDQLRIIVVAPREQVEDALRGLGPVEVVTSTVGHTGRE